jgi:hypothetical protein
MINRFNQYNFETVDFLSESAETPKIKPGGSSSSDLLNRYNKAIAQDISFLTTRTNLLATRAARMATGATYQALSLSSQLSSLSSRVDAVSGFSQVLADFHSNFYIAGANTATIDNLWGQATLPVTSKISVLTSTDVYGNIYVSNEVDLSYTSTSSSGQPSVLNFTSDPEGINMLQNDQLWIVPNTNTYTWIKLKNPIQYLGQSPNVLEVYPFPALGVTLNGIWYQLVGDSNTGTWYQLDISYLPNYSNGTVPQCSPIRVHLTGDPISQLLFSFTSSSPYIGLKSLNLYSVQYNSSATLAVYDPYSRTVGSVILRGKDPSTLSSLGVTKSGSQVQVALASSNVLTTPVITGLVFSVT